MVLHRIKEPLARINALHSFMEMNRHVGFRYLSNPVPYLYIQFLSTTLYSLPTDPQNRALIDQKAQISTDSMVAPSTQISERTTIKRSVIGRHCVIGRMVKITGCILLDHCVIEDEWVLSTPEYCQANRVKSAKLDGCILGKNTRVGTKAELSRCVSQAGYEVQERGLFLFTHSLQSMLRSQ